MSSLKSPPCCTVCTIAERAVAAERALPLNTSRPTVRFRTTAAERGRSLIACNLDSVGAEATGVSARAPLLLPGLLEPIPVLQGETVRGGFEADVRLRVGWNRMVYVCDGCAMLAAQLEVVPQ